MPPFPHRGLSVNCLFHIQCTLISSFIPRPPTYVRLVRGWSFFPRSLSAWMQYVLLLEQGKEESSTEVPDMRKREMGRKCKQDPATGPESRTKASPETQKQQEPDQPRSVLGPYSQRSREAQNIRTKRARVPSVPCLQGLASAFEPLRSTEPRIQSPQRASRGSVPSSSPPLPRSGSSWGAPGRQPCTQERRGQCSGAPCCTAAPETTSQDKPSLGWSSSCCLCSPLEGAHWQCPL